MTRELDALIAEVKGTIDAFMPKERRDLRDVIAQYTRTGALSDEQVVAVKQLLWEHRLWRFDVGLDDNVPWA